MISLEIISKNLEYLGHLKESLNNGPLNEADLAQLRGFYQQILKDPNTKLIQSDFEFRAARISRAFANRSQRLLRSVFYRFSADSADHFDQKKSIELVETAYKKMRVIRNLGDLIEGDFQEYLLDVFYKIFKDFQGDWSEKAMLRQIRKIFLNVNNPLEKCQILGLLYEIISSKNTPSAKSDTVNYLVLLCDKNLSTKSKSDLLYLIVVLLKNATSKFNDEDCLIFLHEIGMIFEDPSNRTSAQSDVLKLAIQLENNVQPALFFINIKNMLKDLKEEHQKFELLKLLKDSISSFSEASEKMKFFEKLLNIYPDMLFHILSFVVFLSEIEINDTQKYSFVSNFYTYSSNDLTFQKKCFELLFSKEGRKQFQLEDAVSLLFNLRDFLGDEEKLIQLLLNTNEISPKNYSIIERLEVAFTISFFPEYLQKDVIKFIKVEILDAFNSCTFSFILQSVFNNFPFNTEDIQRFWIEKINNFSSHDVKAKYVDTFLSNFSILQPFINEDLTRFLLKQYIKNYGYDENHLEKGVVDEILATCVVLKNRLEAKKIINIFFFFPPDQTKTIADLLPEILQNNPSQEVFYITHQIFIFNNVLTQQAHDYLISRLENITNISKASEFSKLILDHIFYFHDSSTRLQDMAYRIKLLTSSHEKNPYVIFANLQSLRANDIEYPKVFFEFCDSKVSIDFQNIKQLTVNEISLASYIQTHGEKVFSVDILDEMLSKIKEKILNFSPEQRAAFFMQVASLSDECIQRPPTESMGKKIFSSLCNNLQDHFFRENIECISEKSFPLITAFLHSIFFSILDTSDDCQVDQVISDREDRLLKTSQSIQNCPTGKKEAVVCLYNLLDTKYKYNSSKKEDIDSVISVKKVVRDIILMNMNTILSSSKFIESLLELDQAPSQLAH